MITIQPIGIGLYGLNGHQIHQELLQQPQGRLVATAAIDPQALPESLRGDAALVHYEALDALLADPRVELVSLCSPRRAEQARDALRCLEAGKHVYAEKPCALTEADLDAIIATARRTGCAFREMANGIAECQPYRALREVVRSGILGSVVQIFAQKSYPYLDSRPQDEDIDGGLIGQNAGHAVRMIEQVAEQQICWIDAIETSAGNPQPGGLQMACALQMRLAHGGIATAIANYCNPRAFGSWGNEHLRVFGTDGMVEITDGGAHTRLVLRERDLGPLDTSQPSIDYLTSYLCSLRGTMAMPRALDEELHATRMTIRAKAAALRHGKVSSQL